MNEREAAHLFEDILSGKRVIDARVPPEVLVALEMAGHLHTTNLSDASRSGPAGLDRLIAQHPANRRPGGRVSLRWALQGMAIFLALAAVGLLFSRALTVALRPQATAAPVALVQPSQAEPAATEAATEAAAQAAIPGVIDSATPADEAMEAPAPEPLEISMAQAVEQLPFPVLAPEDDNTPLTLESVEIPTQDSESNTVIQTYNSPQGEVTITQKEAAEPTAQEQPTEAAAAVNVRGQTGYVTETGSGEKALTWKEGSTDITISGNLPQEQLMMLAENLQPQEPATEQVTIDCEDTFPGLPGCQSREAIASGRLVFVDPRPAFNNRPYVADLQTGAGWPAGDAPGQPVSFSPSSRFLLERTAKGSWQVYNMKGKRTLKLAALPNHTPFDPFWLPPNTLSQTGDWLAMATEGGGLKAYSLPGGQTVQLLPPGTFPTGGALPSQPVVSLDGWMAWTPNPDGLAAGAGQSLLLVPLKTPEKVGSLTLSSDVSVKNAYRLIDWAPGTRTLLLGGWTGGGQEATGMPLYSLNADSGVITRLPAAMLNTKEAYDWNPVKPGLMALAEGGGASIGENKRLALLNVNSGALNYLLLDEQGQPQQNFTVFQPKWSPDGRYIAFAGLQTPEGAPAAEDSLLGRSIYIDDTDGAMSYRKVTAPQEGENGRWIDGWPQWTEDGKQLLYTRQQGGKTDVRVHQLASDKDRLLITGLPDPACLVGGCNWSSILLYTPKPVPAPIPDTANKPTKTLAPTQPTSNPPATATPAPLEAVASAQLLPPTQSSDPSGVESQQVWTVNELAGRWLSALSGESGADGMRLEDWRGVQVTILQDAVPALPSSPTMNFTAQLTVEVKPAAGAASDWAAQGTLQEDGWVMGVQKTVGVAQEGDVYSLYLLP